MIKTFKAAYKTKLCLRAVKFERTNGGNMRSRQKFHIASDWRKPLWNYRSAGLRKKFKSPGSNPTRLRAAAICMMEPNRQHVFIALENTTGKRFLGQNFYFAFVWVLISMGIYASTQSSLTGKNYGKCCSIAQHYLLKFESGFNV